MASGSNTRRRTKALDRLPGDALDDGAEVHEALAGIAEALAGGEVDLQRLAGGTPVREPRAMAQHVSRGQGLQQVIALEVVAAREIRQRAAYRGRAGLRPPASALGVRK